MNVTDVLVLKTFSCAMDSIGIDIKLCTAGNVVGIPSKLVEALAADGYVDTNVQPVIEEEVEVPELEEEIEDIVEEYSTEWFIKQGREEMIKLLDDEEEEYEADATTEALAQLCASLMEDD